jgi:hypothetical protein
MSDPTYQFFGRHYQAACLAPPHLSCMKSVFELWKRQSNEPVPVGVSLQCAASTPKTDAEPWLPVWRPWDGARSINRREAETIDAIEHWLTNGDENSVTRWLAFHLAGRQGFLDKLGRAMGDEDR